MISVVCVYNNEQTLSNVLLKSLANQTVEFELITLDNTDTRFKSAAEALNYGGLNVKGDYIMFVHQDVWLGYNSWLEEVEKILESILDLGVAGVAGMSEQSINGMTKYRYSIDVFDEEWCKAGNKPIRKPEIVQTLDECVLIVPRPVFAKIQFDETVFDGWDCYGTDYCLCVTQLGLKAYVIPAPCAHSTLRACYYYWEFKELLKFHKKLYAKHRNNYNRIYTWMGEVSPLSLRWRTLMQLLTPVYMRLFPKFDISLLKKQLSGCTSVLDLGCGPKSPILRSNIPFSTGVELFEPSLQESKRRCIHNQYIKADIRRIEFKPKSFDAVVAIDVLQYLTKQEGTQLLNKMENWARNKVVLLTPNEYLGPDTYIDNPLQVYKSGWSVKELRDTGFRVRGINGWKRFGGYKNFMKFRSFLWGTILDISQKMAYFYPRMARQLMAIKQIDE